ncbi:MAG: SDR family NAD(P)-dependent oxidoreductase [Spirochaetales bacterium]|uniref:SDR family NAD(P)-dependent oxidoreductase n=1 Tax=Candidatus Thalassospirochaeta sargassi TaxID=3119039 RepID=A0AAJ1MHP5_9SPIO|nr:SDR family NAD(P)-dependent oxidoreductase [Spirochaetales bacterium]
MGLLGYLKQYRIQDMKELSENDKKEPLPCEGSLEGKTAVITGATSGIGLETARLFARKGADLICLNRDPEKSDRVEKELKEKYNCNIKTIYVDFTSFEQVGKAADALLSLTVPIDVIIYNAGVFNTTKQFTADGVEMVFQVNHLGSFFLNYKLKEKLKKENRARIIYVNSEGHRFALAGVHLNDLAWRRHIYTGLKSYGTAKTAQLLTMQKFDEYFSDCSVTVNAMHPGNVRSNMGNNNGRLYRKMHEKLVLSSAKDPEISARALLYHAASEDVSGVSGRFYNFTTDEKPAPHARDKNRVDAVWNKSLELCGLS